ncbi:flagellar biosynthetic protein FliO [Alloiococcus sp. CFN-8]|uniref:flagellar biosynthetic protein FliO n=1 Tax=Alloiococcus sp. CFN-8 TaxID=3416081 RepID=UPI003CE72D4A
MDTITYILKIIFSLIFILLLIYIFYSISSKKLIGLKSTEAIKVIERLPISKDTCLLVVSLGDRGYFLASGPKGFDVIDELTSEEIMKIQEERTSKVENNKIEMDKLIGKLKVKDWLSR